MMDTDRNLLLGVAGALIIIGVIAGRLWTLFSDKPSFIPSPISTAMVIYDSRNISLDTRKLAEIINSSQQGMTAKAEEVKLPQGWILPFVRVSASEDLVVIINDSPGSVENIREIAEEAEKNRLLPQELIARLRNCNAHIDVSSANCKVTATNNTFLVKTTAELDPANPAVQKLLHTLQGYTRGFIYDCVNSSIQTK